MADSDEGFEILKRTLQGYARHPNVAAVLFLSLGGEVGSLQRIDGLRAVKPIRVR